MLLAYILAYPEEKKQKFFYVNFVLFFHQLLVQLHELGDALRFRHVFAVEAVGFHDGSVVGTVSFQKLKHLAFI